MYLGRTIASRRQAVKAILDVSLEDTDRAVFGIGVAYGEEKTSEGAAELHGFVRRVFERGVVNRGPTPVPGMITKEPRLAVSFFLDGGRREHDLYKVLDKFVGQYHPKFVFDELGHLFSNEVSMLGCRIVAPSLDALVFLCLGPRWRVAFGWDPMVTPLS